MQKKVARKTIGLLFFLTVSVNAQTDVGTWAVYKNQLTLSESIRFDTQYQHRSFNLDLAQDQHLITMGLSTRLGSGLFLGAGYRRLETDTFSENGMYQKAALGAAFGNLKISNSFMLEERWIDDDFQMRYRFGTTASYPLNPKITLSIGNEVFLANAQGSFNQNRFTAQITQKIGKNMRLNTGVMHWQFSNIKRWVLLCTFTHSLRI